MATDSLATRSQSPKVASARGSRNTNRAVLTGRAGRGVELGEQREPEFVGGQDVEALVAHERGGAGDRVEGPLDLGPDRLLGLAPARPRRRRVGGAGEVEQVGSLGLVELKRAGQRLQHALRRPRSCLRARGGCSTERSRRPGRRPPRGAVRERAEGRRWLARLGPG